MSDIEHELVRELRQLRAQLDQLTATARRSIRAAIAAQDHAFGAHDDWLDDALVEVAPEAVDQR